VKDQREAISSSSATWMKALRRATIRGVDEARLWAFDLKSICSRSSIVGPFVNGPPMAARALHGTSTKKAISHLAAPRPGLFDLAQVGTKSLRRVFKSHDSLVPRKT
jgi:hypothetical protein